MTQDQEFFRKIANQNHPMITIEISGNILKFCGINDNSLIEISDNYIIDPTNPYFNTIEKILQRKFVR